MRCRPVLTLLMLVAAAALTACGSGNPPVSNKSILTTVSQAPPPTATATDAPSSTPVQEPGTVGYIVAGPTAISYLQWESENSGRFSGTALYDAAKGLPPAEIVSTSRVPIDGQLNGTAFTLDINGQTDLGVLSGATLTLNVVQNDGSIRASTYSPATASDYNAALAQLQQSTQNANVQEQQRQSQAKLQTAAQDALTSLESDNNNFTNAKAIRQDVAKTDSDLQKERQDATSGNGDNCYNITGVVDYDATYVVGYDVKSSASYDVNQEQNGINAGRSDTQSVQSAEAALATAGLPATPGASEAIAIAQQQDAEAVTTTNTAIDSLNADLRPPVIAI